MTLETIIKQYDFNLAYAKALVHDLTDEDMTVVPSNGLDNHPAFTLGHLVSGSADLARDLGSPFVMPKKWAELFVRTGPGDPRKPDPNKVKYPAKELLVKELQSQHDKVKGLLSEINEDRLVEPLKWSFSSYMPSLLDVVAFMCINHEAMHLGQLAAWRRAMGLPSALAYVKNNQNG